MVLKQIIDELNATPVFAADGWEGLSIDSVFASDLISDILVSDGEEQLLLTSLTTPQVVRTASIVGAVAIILVHRRKVPDGLAAAARAGEIPLFLSTMTKYDACVRIGGLEQAQ
jgi:hypothetical protein